MQFAWLHDNWLNFRSIVSQLELQQRSISESSWRQRRTPYYGFTSLLSGHAGCVCTDLQIILLLGSSSSSHLLLGTPHETETHAGPTAVFTHCNSRGEPKTCPHTNTYNYYLIWCSTICVASSFLQPLHQVSNSACVWWTHSKENYSPLGNVFSINMTHAHAICCIMGKDIKHITQL